MKLKYTAEKRLRIKRFGFYGVTTYEDYWYCDLDNRWHHIDEIQNTPELRRGGYGPDCYGVRSVKAFIRKLKQWRKYLPKGVEFILVSRWKHHDVIGKT